MTKGKPCHSYISYGSLVYTLEMRTMSTHDLVQPGLHITCEALSTRDHYKLGLHMIEEWITYDLIARSIYALGEICMTEENVVSIRLREAWIIND